MMGEKQDKRVVPCLDVRDGQVVKGVQFESIQVVGDPGQLARKYQNQGARELVLLDITATKQNRGPDLGVVREVGSTCTAELTVGGGINSVERATQTISAGASKVSVGSAAVSNPQLICDLSSALGSRAVVVALDAARVNKGDLQWEVCVRGGKEPTGRGAVEWAQRLVQMGAGEILLTSVDRDGTVDGYDLALVSAISCAVDVPVIASGGAGTPDDMAEALDAGASAVLAASIFHFGEYTVGQVERFLSELDEK